MAVTVCVAGASVGAAAGFGYVVLAIGWGPMLARHTLHASTFHVEATYRGTWDKPICGFDTGVGTSR